MAATRRTYKFDSRNMPTFFQPAGNRFRIRRAKYHKNYEETLYMKQNKVWLYLELVLSRTIVSRTIGMEGEMFDL